MRCAGHRHPNIPTGVSSRPKPRSSTRLEQTDEARALYRRAMEMAPTEPSIHSNLGMSYVLEGDLRTAEQHMRRASEMPGADSRVPPETWPW